MRQRNDDGCRVIHKKIQRLADHSQGHQTGVHRPVVAQDHLPGKYAQQVTGPKRQGHQDDPDHFVTLDIKGDEKG